MVLSENDGIKELKQLVDGTCKILGVDEVSQITDRLLKVVINGEIETYQVFKDMVGGDLDTDWVQMIFQYYMADRKEKMQDFTPKSVAKLMARLAGKADVVTDMCAGTGALTIQKWSMSKEEYRILREADEEVIPWLLFNMAIRNIDCEIYLEDVLTQKLKRVYRVVEGEQFGKCEVIYDDSVYIEPTV